MQSTSIVGYFRFYPIWTLLRSRPLFLQETTHFHPIHHHIHAKSSADSEWIVYVRLNASWICTQRYRFKCRVLVSPNLPSNAVNPLKYQWHLPTTDIIMRGESIQRDWIATENSSNYRDSMIRSVLISSWWDIYLYDPYRFLGHTFS